MEKQGTDKRLNRLNTFQKEKTKKANRLLEDIRNADKHFSNRSSFSGFQSSHEAANQSLMKKLGGAI